MKGAFFAGRGRGIASVKGPSIDIKSKSAAIFWVLCADGGEDEEGGCGEDEGSMQYCVDM